MNSAAANAVAAILLGCYLLAINLRTGGKDRSLVLIALLHQEGGFLKWVLAGGALWFLASRPELGNIGAGLIALTLIILAIKVANDPSILGAIESVWNSLPTGKKGVNLPSSVNTDFLGKG